MKKTCLIVLAFLAFTYHAHAQKFENLAQTPPMGWNSWNTFSVNINEQLVRDVADAFVKHGLKDAGYEYIVMDDGWMAKERDKAGNLVPDPKKFPGGLKALVDYVHSKGLKMGIYNCAGATTCGGYPGSRGHEYQDALKYAEWGIDYLKYDWCNTDKINSESAYTTMRDALKTAGRPMVFSICEWGDTKPWKWAKDVGHLWRVSGDITNCWDCELDHGTWSSLGVLNILDLHKADRLRQYAGPGHWNDLDMMEIGNGMSTNEDRSHFALWCMNASALMLGNDLNTVSKQTIETITNKEVIAVNQDPLGIQGFSYYSTDDLEIWLKPLANDEWAVCFLNRSDAPIQIKFDWKAHEYEDNFSKKELHIPKQDYTVRDLYQHKNIGTTADVFEREIGIHDVIMLKLSKK